MIGASIRMLVGTMALTLMACQVDRAQAQTKNSVFEDVVEHQVIRLDVDFSGGKIIDYIETIRRAFPNGAANIVVMPNAQAIEVPPISLVAVTVEAAVSLLKGTYTPPDGRSVGISVDAYQIDGTTDKVFKLSLVSYDRSDIISKVWSLEQVLSGDQSERELLGAIDVVQSLFSNRAEIKYHSPTRLLIARGTAEQLNLVREVIEQFIGSMEQKKERTRYLRSYIENMMDQHQERLTAKIDMEAMLEEEKKNLEKLVQQHTQGEIAEQEVIEARGEIKLDQAHSDRINSQLDRINQRLKKAQDSLAELTGPSL